MLTRREAHNAQITRHWIERPSWPVPTIRSTQLGTFPFVRQDPSARGPTPHARDQPGLRALECPPAMPLEHCEVRSG
jgi:hypothetical protein